VEGAAGLGDAHRVDMMPVEQKPQPGWLEQEVQLDE
jgi:hypothetical protein